MRLNIVCCRYLAPGLDEDALNAAIVVSMQERGVAVTSTSRIAGRLCNRVCVTNHRSREDNFDRLMAELIETGTRLARERGGAV